MELLVFAGTVEGRKLVEWLDERGTCSVVACTATAYGSKLLSAGTHVEPVQGPLSSQQKRDLMESHEFSCIVDATHAFAEHISASIDELASAYNKDVLRVVRERSDADVRGATVVDNAQAAARIVAEYDGNVLLTTGTRNLATFVGCAPDVAKRLYVRILPVTSSLVAVQELGIPTSHIVAMQGPFSTELNEALIREFNIGLMVTKESGRVGGFEQKVQAAHACGTDLVVIRRPDSREGMSLSTVQRLLEERYGA